MIIWGWSTKNIGVIPFAGECKTCHHHGLQLAAFQSMFDLFWIPTFPLKKTYCVLCDQCGTQYNPEIFANYQEIMQSAGTKFKSPWWSFSGLGLIALFALWIAYLGYTDIKIKDDFKRDPHIGDLIIFKPAEADSVTPYTFAKVVNVEDNKVIVYFSTYAYSSRSLARRSAKNNVDSHLLTDAQELTREEIQALSITEVIR